VILSHLGQSLHFDGRPATSDFTSTPDLSLHRAPSSSAASSSPSMRTLASALLYLTPPPELALATQLSKEKSKPSGPLAISAERFNSSVARLTSSSIDELQGLVSELQKMQEFLKSEVDNVQCQIDSALAGINIIVETIGPWKSIAGSQTLPPGTRNVRAGGLAANIEQRIRGG
jgi:hypothetical protein